MNVLNVNPICLPVVTIVVLIATRADAHGTPIRVTVDENRNALVVDVAEEEQVDRQGINGFAPWIIAEDDEDGDPQGTVTLPSLGPAVLWTVPGFAISEMHSSSRLSIEVLVRPVVDEDATERRALWYWNPANDTVEAAPEGSALYLLGTGGRSLTIPRNQSAPLPPFLLAETVAGQLGEHNHDLLAYALDNSPAAAPGVYGFFARLTSNHYGPSNPFLIALNHDLPYDDVFAAAHAINRFAFLPGDYNHDDEVDMDDYPVWKSSYDEMREDYELADGNGNGIVDAADYTVWRNNVGASLGSGASIHAYPQIPEPACAMTLAVASLPLLLCRRGRIRRRSACRIFAAGRPRKI